MQCLTSIIFIHLRLAIEIITERTTFPIHGQSVTVVNSETDVLGLTSARTGVSNVLSVCDSLETLKQMYVTRNVTSHICMNQSAPPFLK